MIFSILCYPYFSVTVSPLIPLRLISTFFNPHNLSWLSLLSNILSFASLSSLLSTLSFSTLISIFFLLHPHSYPLFSPHFFSHSFPLLCSHFYVFSPLKSFPFFSQNFCLIFFKQSFFLPVYSALSCTSFLTSFTTSNSLSLPPPFL